MAPIRSTISPNCSGTQRSRRATHRSGCHGTTGTHWYGWPRLQQRNMMSPAWPKRIDGGQRERTWCNSQKTGFPESKSEPRFWPGTKAGENVARRAIRPCFDQRPSNTEVGHAETMPPPRWTVVLQVQEVNSAAGKARSPRRALRRPPFSIWCWCG